MQIGLLGGGQLGRMMIQAAHRLGHTVALLDPDPQGPAGQLADDHVIGDFKDPAALAQFARKASVFTTEFENVPAASLRFLAEHGKTMPSADCVERAQDRLIEKAFIESAGVAVAPHWPVFSREQALALPPAAFPGILKTSRLGYDGKGQLTVVTAREAAKAFEAFGRVACLLEKRLALRQEVSVILARGADAEVAVFPLAENVHRSGILHTTTVPANVSEALAHQAQADAQAIAQAMEYVGVLCVEFFVLEDGQLVANEMAPRPHNSGHHSIEACETSQFEQQVRICTGMPLGSPGLRFPVRMTNLLGDLWFPSGSDGPVVTPDWSALTSGEQAVLHLYGKSEPRPGRKMGHITERLLGQS